MNGRAGVTNGSFSVMNGKINIDTLSI